MAKKAARKKAATDPRIVAGQGLDFGPDELQMPRLSIAQAQSEAMNPKSDGYVPGANIGDIISSIDKRCYPGDDGVEIIACARTTKYLEWLPRNSGGGIAGIYGPEEGRALMASATRGPAGMTLPNGNTIHDSKEYLVLALDDEGKGTPHLLSFAKSGIAIARNWNTRMASYYARHKDASIISQVWRLTTAPKANDAGTWFGWKIDAVEGVTALDRPLALDDALHYAEAGFGDVGLIEAGSGSEG